MAAAIGPRPMADAWVGQKTGITRRWDNKTLGLFLVAQFAPKTGPHFSDCA